MAFTRVYCPDRLEHIFRQRLIHKPWLRIDWIFKLSSLYRKQKQVLSDANASVDKVKIILICDTFLRTFSVVFYIKQVIRNRRESHRQKAEKHSSQLDSANNEDLRPSNRSSHSHPSSAMFITLNNIRGKIGLSGSTDGKGVGGEFRYE